MHLETLLHRSNRCLALVVLALLIAGTSPARAGIGDLYVTSDATNIVTMYDGVTGAGIGNFTPSFAANGQMAIHFGATNGRVLVGHSFGGVEEFNATTGGYIKTYNAGGGWQWAGIYAPNGDALVGDMFTNDVRRYDSNTGAFLSVLCPIPGPADMEYGPNGHLYICSYLSGFVLEVNPNTGAPFGVFNLPPGSRANDVAFLPNGEVLVTDMSAIVVYRFSPAHTILGTFAGTGWGRPHGITLSPTTGNIMVVDGVTAQVHEFDPSTFTELNPSWLNPWPQLKIVDLAFRPVTGTATQSTSWGRIKNLYR